MYSLIVLLFSWQLIVKIAGYSCKLLTWARLRCASLRFSGFLKRQETQTIMLKYDEPTIVIVIVSHLDSNRFHNMFKSAVYPWNNHTHLNKNINVLSDFLKDSTEGIFLISNDRVTRPYNRPGTQHGFKIWHTNLLIYTPVYVAMLGVLGVL
jgi:hypothetical protein